MYFSLMKQDNHGLGEEWRRKTFSSHSGTQEEGVATILNIAICQIRWKKKNSEASHTS